MCLKTKTPLRDYNSITRIQRSDIKTSVLYLYIYIYLFLKKKKGVPLLHTGGQKVDTS